MRINACSPAHPQTLTNTTPAVPLPDLTTAQLLGWILAALFLQASGGIGAAIWRRPRGAAEAEPAAPPPSRSASNAAWAGTREFRVVSRAYEDAARSQCSFYLQPVDGQPLPDFRPGQFLTFVLQLKDDTRQGERRSVTRCYSLSDAPAPDHYRVSIKRVPPPAGRPELAPGLSSNHFHDQVQVGDVLQVKAPSGHFYIDPDPSVPAVLVAGGIGITPMMSMLRWCLSRQPERQVHLYYGLRQGNECVQVPARRTGQRSSARQAERGLQPPCSRRRAGSGLPAHRSRGSRAASADPAAWAAPVLYLRTGGHDGKPGAGARRMGCTRG